MGRRVLGSVQLLKERTHGRVNAGARTVMCAHLVLGMTVGSAKALVNPRDEMWTIERRSDTQWRVLIRFEADISAADVDGASGLRFGIAQRHGGVVSNSIVSYVIDMPYFPPVGSPVVVTADVTVFCGSSGVDLVSPQERFITWCEPASGQRTVWGYGTGRGGVGNLDLATPYDIIVLGEGSNQGSTPSVENPIVCGQSQNPLPTPSHTSHIFDQLESLSGASTIVGMQLRGLRGALGGSRSVVANPGTLELSFEPTSAVCDGPAPADEPVRLYVLMRLGDVTECGVAGGEFRVDGIPQSWVGLAQPSQPHTIAIGNPLADGVVFGFACARDAGGLVPVYELLIVPATFEQDLTLRITRHLQPGNPHFECPVMTSCDPPVFSMWCVDGGRAVLNPRTLSCTTAIQPATWTRVKSLYRN